MQDSIVGIVLMAGIILVGCIVSLALSKGRKQRIASLVAFLVLAVLLASFCIVVIQQSTEWALPLFIVACPVVPLIAYIVVSALVKDKEKAQPFAAPSAKVAGSRASQKVAPQNPSYQVFSGPKGSEKPSLQALKQPAPLAAAAQPVKPLVPAKKTAASVASSALSSNKTAESKKPKSAAYTTKAAPPVGSAPGIVNQSSQKADAATVAAEKIAAGTQQAVERKAVAEKEAAQRAAARVAAQRAAAERAAAERAAQEALAKKAAAVEMATAQAAAVEAAAAEAAAAERFAEKAAAEKAAAEKAAVERAAAERVAAQRAAAQKAAAEEAARRAAEEAAKRAAERAALEQAAAEHLAAPSVIPAESAPQKAVAEETQPASKSLNYAACFEKASGFRDKGIHLVAARLYEESFYVAQNKKERLAALFEAMSCYVKAEKLDEAGKVARELQKNVNDLNPIQVMKLDAVLRMA